MFDTLCLKLVAMWLPWPIGYQSGARMLTIKSVEKLSLNSVAWDEGGLFLLTMHPHIAGHRSRMPVLERLIKHMKARGRCWFATHEQVARWCKDNA